MKKLLFIISLLACTMTFAQKLLSSKVEKQFNEFFEIDNIDSTVYNYNSWDNFINELKPKFGYSGDIMDYSMADLFTHSNSEDKYSFQNAYPLVFLQTITNTLEDNMVIESAFGDGLNRQLYDYNSQGEKVSKTKQYLTSGIWETFDSTTYTYDIMGNKTTETKYLVSPSGANIEETDTFLYVTNTNDLEKATTYFFNGTGIVIDNQTIVTYNGNEVQYVDLYEDNGSGGIDWIFRLNYYYLGDLVSNWKAFEIQNNMLDTTTVSMAGFFTYNLQNEIALYTNVANSDTTQMTSYEYSADGFVTQVTEFIGVAGGFYIGSTVNYYFTNTSASVNELEQLEVLIFPNPTTNILRVQSNEPINRIQIVNMTGNIVLVQNNSDEIEVSHLANGNYVIRGESDNKQFNRIFVKR